MRPLLLCLILACSPAFAQDEVTVPFEGIKVYDELPDYVYAMPFKVYQKWADLQNRGAYRECERFADAWRERNPFRETYVQSSDYDADVTQSQSEKVSQNAASMTGHQRTKFRGNNMQRAYRSGEGGVLPVVILNPYCPRPAKVIIKDDGTVYCADPDKTLKNPEEAEKLIEEYLNESA